MKGKNNSHKGAANARKLIREELEVLKSDVREAYSISAQINLGKGFEPSERDLKLVEEQTLNLKLIEKLEKIRNELSDLNNTKNQERVLFEKTIPYDSQTMLHFFYIVRLAQQGFFHLISGAHPALEYQAVQYVCDTLISYSVRNTRSTSSTERAAYTEIIWDIYNGLMEERDEPVGKGFKTTFKDIMNAAHCLIDKSIQQPQESIPTTHHHPSPPPVWFVMPYTSMMDNQMFLPGTMPPTLPFHSDYLSSNVSSSKRQKERNNQRNNNNNNNRKNDKSKPEEVESVEEDKKDASNETVKDVKGEEEETKESGSDEEDRFADPDMSDEYDDESDKEESVKEEVKEEVKKEETVKEKDKKETPTLNSDQNNSNDNNDSSSTDEVAKANTSWLNFAASSTPPETSSNHSSPKRSGYRNY